MNWIRIQPQNFVNRDGAVNVRWLRSNSTGGLVVVLATGGAESDIRGVAGSHHCLRVSSRRRRHQPHAPLLYHSLSLQTGTVICLFLRSPFLLNFPIPSSRDTILFRFVFHTARANWIQSNHVTKMLRKWGPTFESNSFFLLFTASNQCVHLRFLSKFTTTTFIWKNIEMHNASVLHYPKNDHCYLFILPVQVAAGEESFSSVLFAFYVKEARLYWGNSWEARAGMCYAVLFVLIFFFFFGVGWLLACFSLCVNGFVDL